MLVAEHMTLTESVLLGIHRRLQVVRYVGKVRELRTAVRTGALRKRKNHGGNRG